MKYLKGLVLVSSFWLLVGCSPKVVYQTEYVEVEVPVKTKIHRPDRPIREEKEGIHKYLLRVLEYTELLEVLIDESNK